MKSESNLTFRLIGQIDKILQSFVTKELNCADWFSSLIIFKPHCCIELERSKRSLRHISAWLLWLDATLLNVQTKCQWSGLVAWNIRSLKTLRNRFDSQPTYPSSSLSEYCSVGSVSASPWLMKCARLRWLRKIRQASKCPFGCGSNSSCWPWCDFAVSSLSAVCAAIRKSWVRRSNTSILVAEWFSGCIQCYQIRLCNKIFLFLR